MSHTQQTFADALATQNKGCWNTACPNVPPAPGDLCETCLDRVRHEDREAEYDNYGDYLREKFA